jgi:hypothetical protein
MEESKNMFQKRIRRTEDCSIGKRREKKMQILYFDHLLFLLLSVEDHVQQKAI